MEQLSDIKYRALWITSSYPYVDNTIAGTFVKEHAQAARLFDEITILHLLERQRSVQHLWEIDVTERGDKGNLPLIRVKAKQSRLPFTTFPIHILSAFSGLRKCQERGLQFDIVHAHSYRAGVPGAMIAKWLKVPLVITEHNSIFSRKALHGFDHLKAAFAYRSASIVLPVSTALQRALQAYKLGSQYQVIGNTFDPMIFFPNSSDPVNKPLRLMIVTNLIPLKRVDLLIRALKAVSPRLPSWELQIIGDGPERGGLEQLTKELELSDKVSFSGILSKPQIAEALRASDLFLLSSSHETFSVATLEALACGVPVLATACGGPEDFITPEIGRLVQPDNQTALEIGLVSIICKLDQFDRSNIAKIIHRKFSYDAIGEQIHHAYQSVLSPQVN